MKLAGTIRAFTRHVVVLDGLKHHNWAKQVEMQHSMMNLFHLSPSKELKVSLAESKDSLDGNDLLVFPDMIRLRNVSLEKAKDLIPRLNDPAPFAEHEAEPLTGYHLLVCVHGTRDKRCGCRGPELIEWIQQLGRPDVTVWPTSHFGGHRFAPNGIFYPSGDWYGCITSKEQVESILDGRKKDVEHLFRGNPFDMEVSK